MDLLSNFAMATSSANKLYNTLHKNQIQHFAISHGKVFLWYEYNHEPRFIEILLRDIFNDRLFDLLWKTGPFVLSDFIEELFVQINDYLERVNGVTEN